MDVPEQIQPCGQELIQKLITLTGLPEPLVNQELEQILGPSSDQTSELTLEELRAAMIQYLEHCQAEFEKEEAALGNPTAILPL
jgi:hypothetical protein